MFLVFQGKTADVQPEPNPACWGAVCAGADCFLSTLAPTPTATSQKKKNWQTEDSARIYFIEGNHNLLTIPQCLCRSSPQCHLESVFIVPMVNWIHRGQAVQGLPELGYRSIYLLYCFFVILILRRIDLRVIYFYPPADWQKFTVA